MACDDLDIVIEEVADSKRRNIFFWFAPLTLEFGMTSFAVFDLVAGSQHALTFWGTCCLGAGGFC